MRKQWKRCQILFLGGPKSLQMVTAAMKLKKMLTPWKESYDQPRQHIQKQRYYFVNKGPSSQGYGFPVVMYGCESWTVKKSECQRIDAFELWCWRRLSKEIQPVYSKGDQPWVFFGRNDAKAETPVLWPPHAKS